MNERDKTRLHDMLDAATKAREFMQGRSREDLHSYDMLAYAVIRAIDIVWEVVTRGLVVLVGQLRQILDADTAP